MKANKWVLVVLGVIAICICITVSVVVVLFVIGANTSTSLDSDSTDEAIAKYFEADTKHGKFSSTGTDEDGTAEEPETGEYWVSGEEFRLDFYYSTGEQRISIISHEGVAYFCVIGDDACEPSVAPVEYYMSLFTKPDVASVDTEEDSAENCTRYNYQVEKTYDMAGSTNQWYNDSITYCVTTDDVVYTETRGTIPEDDGSIGPLDYSKYSYSLTEIGIDIDDEIFALPYEIATGE